MERLEHLEETLLFMRLNAGQGGDGLAGRIIPTSTDVSGRQPHRKTQELFVGALKKLKLI